MAIGGESMVVSGSLGQSGVSPLPRDSPSGGSLVDASTVPVLLPP